MLGGISIWMHVYIMCTCAVVCVWGGIDRDCDWRKFAAYFTVYAIAGDIDICA